MIQSVPEVGRRPHSRALARNSYLQYVDATEPGMYHDGGGLYLRVSMSGAKSWLYRYMINGRARSMGLGSFRLVSLKKARKRAYDAAVLLEEGIDPLATKAVRLLDEPVTFEDHTNSYIKSREKGWKGSHNKSVWEQSMGNYAYPIIGSMHPRMITLPHIQSVIEPIWNERTQTAKRLLKRIETVLDYSKALDPRRDVPGRWPENPARWVGLWNRLKESPKKTAPTQSHRSIGYVDLGKFMVDLVKEDSTAVAPLELLILTAARAEMVLAAEWEEINLEEKIWTLPALRMKNQKEFRIPLGDRAVEIVEKMKLVKENGFVFPGGGMSGHLSRTIFFKFLERMTEWTDKVVPHGFRSTFRTWAAEETDHPDDVCEMALAHSQGDETYEAYQRGDLLRKRRLLMNDWNDFVVTSKLAA